jgi:hypothetical protein
MSQPVIQGKGQLHEAKYPQNQQTIAQKIAIGSGQHRQKFQGRAFGWTAQKHIVGSQQMVEKAYWQSHDA